MDDFDETLQDSNPKIRAGQIVCTKTRRLKIMKAVRRFVHACSCSDVTCTNTNCDEMKSIAIHFQNCSRQPKKDCHSCRQFLALCLYHAKRSKDCESNLCPVPYCIRFKETLKQKRAKKGKKTTLNPGDRIINDVVEIADSDNEDVVSLDSPLEQQGESSTGYETSVDYNSENASITSSENLQDEIEPEQPRFPSANSLQINDGNVLYYESFLKTLLHADKCLLEETQRVASWPCFESNCGIMKQVLRHIYDCHDNECTFLHCVSAKTVLNHWRYCNDRNCDLCVRVRQSLGRYNPQEVPVQIPVPVAGPSNSDAYNGGTKIIIGVSQRTREYMISKIVSTMVSSVVPVENNNPRMNRAYHFARMTENLVYNRANSKLEYFRLIAERVYKIMRAVRVRQRPMQYETYTVNNPGSSTEQVPMNILPNADPQPSTSSNNVASVISNEELQMLEFLKTNPPLMRALAEEKMRRSGPYHQTHTNSSI